MNLFWKNKFCFLLGLVTKTNPRLIEDKRAKPFFPAQRQRKEIDTFLVQRHLFTHPFINPWTPTHDTHEDYIILDVVDIMSQSVWILQKKKPKRMSK
jgi:hypothetical protein